MRLKESDAAVIKEAVCEVFGREAEVRLFGSRVDDSARGGDIDLMVTVGHPVENPALAIAKVETRIIRQLGERKIDVVLNAPNLTRSEIHRIAQEQGVRL